MVKRGDIVWLDFGEPVGSEPAYVRPAIVVSGDAYNASKLKTVIVCALTSNMRLAGLPGNVEFEKGQCGLPKACVANVTQVLTVHKWQVIDHIGHVPAAIMRKLAAGLKQSLELT